MRTGSKVTPSNQCRLMSRSSSRFGLRRRSYRRSGIGVQGIFGFQVVVVDTDQPADLAFVLANQGVAVTVHLGVEFVLFRFNPIGNPPK